MFAGNHSCPAVVGSAGGIRRSRRCLISGNHVVSPTLTLRRSRSGTNPKFAKPDGIENLAYDA